MNAQRRLASIYAGCAAAAAVAGSAAGATAVQVAGYGAVGMVGGGAGIGAPAGPVGAAFGALLGLSAFGLAVVVKTAYDAAHAQDTESHQAATGAWEPDLDASGEDPAPDGS